MKKLLYILVAIFSLSFAACTEDTEVQGVGEGNIYFPTTSPTYIELDSSSESLSVALKRVETESAQSFELMYPDLDGAFSAPASVSFEAGSDETAIEIGIDMAKIVEDREYVIDIQFADENEAVFTHGLGSLQVTAILSPWELMSGTGTMMDAISTAFLNGDPAIIECNVSKHKSIEGMYRFEKPYANYVDIWDGAYGMGTDFPIISNEAQNIIIDARVDDQVGISEGVLGLDISGIGECTLGAFEPGTFSNGTISFPPKSLGMTVTDGSALGADPGTYYANSEVTFVMTIPGAVATPSVDVDFAGTFVGSNGAMSAVFDFATNAATTSYRYAVAPSTASANDVLASIVDGTGDFAEQTAAGRYEVAVDGAGKYFIVVVAYGANGVGEATALQFTIAGTSGGGTGPSDEVLVQGDFDVVIESRTSTDIVYSVTPTNFDGPWYPFVFTKAVYDQYSNEELISAIFDLESDYGTDFEAVDDIYVFEGAQSNISISDAWTIPTEDELVFGVFGFTGVAGSSAASVANPTYVYTALGTSGGGGSTGSDFDAVIEVENITETTADIYWQVSDQDQEYVYALFSTAAFANAGITDESEMMGAVIYSLASQGQLEQCILTGNNGGQFTGLSADTELIMMIFAIDGSHSTATSDLFSNVFSTGDGTGGGGGGDITDFEPIQGDFDVTVASSTPSNIFVDVDPGSYTGNYYVIAVPAETYAQLGNDADALLEAMIDADAGYVDYDIVDDTWVFSGAASNISLADAWTMKSDSGNIVIAVYGIEGFAGEDAAETDVAHTVIMGQFAEAEATDEYNAWLGTWELTSTSSEVTAAALTVEIIITDEDASPGASYNIYGWDLSGNRWYVGLPAAFDSTTNGWSVLAENYIGTTDEGDIKYCASGYVGDPYNDYYFITGGYDAFEATMGADGESGAIACYEGTITGDAPFTSTTMKVVLQDAADDLYTFATDESLGFDESEGLVGPFTLTKVSDDTTLPDVASAPAAAPAAKASLLKAHAMTSKFTAPKSISLASYAPKAAFGTISDIVISSINKKSAILDLSAVVATSTEKGTFYPAPKVAKASLKGVKMQ